MHDPCACYRRHAVSTKPPLVSVIVPAYNAERFLGRAMRSALAQTFLHLELIVVDDGSTDGTAEVIRSFRDRRVRHLSQPNRGQGAARNQGIRVSAGRYLTFLDADDAYFPEKIQRQVEFLETHPGDEIVFCNALHFDSRRPGRLLIRRAGSGSGDIFRDLLRSSFINPNTMMVVGDILRGGFLFREERYYPEEWDLCLRLARAGCRFVHQDEALVVVELREDSNTAMVIQWDLKRHTLEMFERLFREMTMQERTVYRADEVLRSNRTKLALAALVSTDPVVAAGASSQALPPLLAFLMNGTLKVAPVGAVRAIAVAAWKFRQRLSYTRVCDRAAQEAWAEIRAQGGENSASAHPSALPEPGDIR